MLRGVVGHGGIINGRQAVRVPYFVTMLNDSDYPRFRALLTAAATDLQRGAICEALTQISNYTMTDLETFASDIFALGDDELVRRLNVIDEEHAPTAAGTPGITQQYDNSCVVTSRQADRAQDDPIYAFALTAETLTEQPDHAPHALNERLRDDQREGLLANGVRPGDRGSHVPGMSHEGYENAVNFRANVTGLMTDMRPIGVDGYSMENALRDIRSSVENSIRVYIRIGDRGSGGHSVLVVGYEAGTYHIHDPWAGRTFPRTEEQIRSGNVDIAGWPLMTHVLVPVSTSLPATTPRAE
jgi:hypothetical protein